MVEDAIGNITLGVVIAIPQPHATVLTKWRHDVGDPAAELIPPHVTLLPPLSVPASSMPVVETHLTLAAKTIGAFDMHLLGTGTFRPATQVVFVQVARGVGDCEALESAVRQGVLARELEFPYHPHVTVAQDVPDSALDTAYDGLAGFVARFRVEDLVLCVRGEGGRWQWRTSFALATGEVSQLC